MLKKKIALSQQGLLENNSNPSRARSEKKATTNLIDDEDEDLLSGDLNGIAVRDPGQLD